MSNGGKKFQYKIGIKLGKNIFHEALKHYYYSKCPLHLLCAALLKLLPGNWHFLFANDASTLIECAFFLKSKNNFIFICNEKYKYFIWKNLNHLR